MSEREHILLSFCCLSLSTETRIVVRKGGRAKRMAVKRKVFTSGQWQALRNGSPLFFCVLLQFLSLLSVADCRPKTGFGMSGRKERKKRRREEKLHTKDVLAIFLFLESGIRGGQ